MRVSLSHNTGVHFGVLSDDQCEQIVMAACEVLERVGSRFYEPAATDILRKAGCMVGAGQLVRIPSALVQQALNSAPSCFTLYTRTGEPAIRVEPNRAYFGPGPTCPYFIDAQTRERRPFVKRDAGLTAHVCDALPNIDYVMSLGSISDVPQEKTDIHEFDAMVRQTTKPIMSWSFSLESLVRIHEMCSAVKGSQEAYGREPFWFPWLMDRFRYGEWVEAGARTMGDRIRDRLCQLVQEHHAPPLEADSSAALDKLVAK